MNVLSEPTFVLFPSLSCAFRGLRLGHQFRRDPMGSRRSAALRFTFSALPWLLFINRPQVPWPKLAAFGVLLGVGQFALLFLAMRGDISPGLASLVIQVQCSSPSACPC
jgi:drug/metabolite transporter (DMT)-like permease